MVQTVLASDLKPAGLRLVALVLAWHVNDESGLAWPSLATVANEAGITRVRVKQCLKTMLAAAVLEVASSGAGGNPQATTRYRFCSVWVGKHATGVAGLPGKHSASDPVSRLSKGGKQAYPKNNERKPSASLSLKTPHRSASDAPRGRTAATRAAETFDGVDYRGGL